MEDSPTLSQMLVTRRESFSGFMYPEACERSPKQPCATVLDTPVQVKIQNESSCITPVSVPPKRFAYSSATKSLGIRRRIRPALNAASPELGVKRRKIVATGASTAAAVPESKTDACATEPVVTPVRCSIKQKDFSSEGRPRRSFRLSRRKNGPTTFLPPVQSIPLNFGDYQGEYTTVTTQSVDVKNLQNVNESSVKIDTAPMTGSASTKPQHNPENIQGTNSTSTIPEAGARPRSALSKVESECIEQAQEKGRNDGCKQAQEKGQNDGTIVGDDDTVIGFPTANNKIIHIPQKAMKYAETLMNHMDSIEPENCKQNQVCSNTPKSLPAEKTSKHDSNPTEDAYDLLSSIDLDEISPCCNRSPSPVLLSKHTRKRQQKIENNASPAVVLSKLPVQEVQKETPCGCSMSDGLDVSLLAVDLSEKFGEDNTDGKTSKQPSLNSQDKEKLPSNAAPGRVDEVPCIAHSAVHQSSSHPVQQLHNPPACDSSTSSALIARPKVEQAYVHEIKCCAKFNLDKNVPATAGDKNADDGFSSDDDILIQFGHELDKAGFETGSTNVLDGKVQQEDENAGDQFVESPEARKALDEGPQCVSANKAHAVNNVVGQRTVPFGHTTVNPNDTVGFVTASNKKVHISDEALAKANKLINDNLNTTQQSSLESSVRSTARINSPSLIKLKSPGRIRTDSTAYSVQQNFPSNHTVGNKLAEVASGGHTKIAYGTLGNGMDVIKVTNVKANVESCHSASMAQQNFVGFKTASNKPVTVSDDALAKAKVLLSKDSDGVSEDHEIVQPTSSAKSGSMDPKPHVKKLTNLFEDGASRIGKTRNKQFKPPGRLNFKSPLKPVKQPAECTGLLMPANPHLPVVPGNEAPLSRRLLGIKNCGDSQISISDESLVKAAEMLEDLLG